MEGYDLQALCDHIGGTREYQAQRLGFTDKTDHRFRRMLHRQLTIDEADRLACRVGVHPSEVWPHYWPMEDAATKVFVGLWAQFRDHGTASPAELRRASAIGTFRLVEQGVY